MKVESPGKPMCNLSIQARTGIDVYANDRYYSENEIIDQVGGASRRQKTASLKTA
jgi:hypothetical protein